MFIFFDLYSSRFEQGKLVWHVIANSHVHSCNNVMWFKNEVSTHYFRWQMADDCYFLRKVYLLLNVSFSDFMTYGARNNCRWHTEQIIYSIKISLEHAVSMKLFLRICDLPQQSLGVDGFRVVDEHVLIGAS